MEVRFLPRPQTAGSSGEPTSLISWSRVVQIHHPLLINTKTMTDKEFKLVFDRAVERARKTLLQKSKEYGQEDDKLESFKIQAGMSLHETPMGSAYELMVKHIYSIRKIVSNYDKQGKRPTVAELNEKIGDAINYMILIEALFLEALYLDYDNDFYPDSNEHSIQG